MSGVWLSAAAGCLLASLVPAPTGAQTPRLALAGVPADSVVPSFELSAAVAPQSAARVRPRLLRVGKWTLLGAALGMGAYALVRSQDAEEQYETLRRLCETDQTRCQLQGSRYADPEAETLYQTAILHDRRARIGIVGAQVSLLGSVALFIADLGNDRGPEDIPYPSSRSRRFIAVGLRLTR